MKFQIFKWHYALFLLSLILTVTFVTSNRLKENFYELNFHDTYYIISKPILKIFTAILFFIFGIGYSMISKSLKRIPLIIHVVICLFLSFLLLTENSFVSILLLLMLGIILFVRNIVFGFIKRKKE